MSRAGDGSKRPPTVPPPAPDADQASILRDPEVEAQRSRDIWTVIVGLRVLNATSLATFFQPDEFFQALEPAWGIAFSGVGPGSGPWITWEWQHGLRSSLLPYALSVAYRIAAGATSFVGFPPPVQAQLLGILPGMLMALVAAAMEYSTWRLSERIYGKATNESWAVIAMMLLSPWQWFVSTRTLSNGVEASLTAMAMTFWPWALLDVRASAAERKKDLSRLKYSLMLATVACVLRPTNAMIWALLATYTMSATEQGEMTTMFWDASVFGPVILVATMAIDKLYYGEWIFPPAKWLHYNLTQDLAVFYGQNRPDYYFTEGLPILLTTALPFALYGMYKSLITFTSTPPGRSTIPAGANPAILRPLTAVVLTTTGALSLISHKEVRFLHPLLPALILLAAQPLTTFFAPFPNPSAIWKKLLLGFFLLVNVTLGVYVSFYHQRGVMDVTRHLRTAFETANYELLVIGNNAEHEPYNHLSVAFLMPCHSTPWRSHLVHPEIEAWALTCEPPLDVPLAERASYMDEADIFYADPVAWLRANMATDSPPVPWSDGTARRLQRHAAEAGRRSWPQYIVFFEQLIAGPSHGDSSSAKDVERMLVERGYKECWRGFNSHWHDDWRRTGDVLAWCIAGDAEEHTAKETMWQANHGRWAAT